MAEAVLITGGNLGDVDSNLARALELITRHAGEICAVSSVMESEAWGFSATERFLNQVVVIRTELQPLQLLESVQAIERELGRRRENESDSNETSAEGRKYHSRTMDIDILFYDNIVLREPRLTIPHPMLHERSFVLQPLAQVLGGYRHPLLGKSVGELWQELNDKTKKL